MNLVRLDRNTINCPKPDYPNCFIIFLELLFKIFWFFPTHIHASLWHPLVLGTLATTRALSFCLLLLPYLSHRKLTLCTSMLYLLRPHAVTTSAEIWVWVLNVGKKMNRWSKIYTSCKTFCWPTETAREVVGKWRENKRNESEHLLPSPQDIWIQDFLYTIVCLVCYPAWNGSQYLVLEVKG